MKTANGSAAAVPASGPTVGSSDEDPTVDAIIDGLYAGSREGFIKARNAAAKQLAARGNADAAARVKALAKPSLSAWAVDRLWWGHREQVVALQRAGRRQAEAVQSGAGPQEQAAAAKDRRRTLEGLLELAMQELEAHGHATGQAVRRKISTTLEALAAHGGREGGPHPGRLTEDLDPPGFDLVAGLGPLPPAPDLPPPPLDPADDDARAEARAELARARHAREAAHGAMLEAARALDEVTKASEAAQLGAQRAAQTHEQAVHQAEAARRAADSAALAMRRTQAVARQEQQRRDDARRVLEARTQHVQELDAALEVVQQRLAELETP